jgi:hypothetical protein
VDATDVHATFIENILSFLSHSLKTKVARADEETSAVVLASPKMEDQKEAAVLTAEDEGTRLLWLHYLWDYMGSQISYEDKNIIQLPNISKVSIHAVQPMQVSN